jgi:tetratricopeptide (TPR) repeat protein
LVAAVLDSGAASRLSSKLIHATNYPKFMLEQAASALNRRDYQTAAKLIAALMVERPDDYQVQLYAAQLDEATGQLDQAVEIYRSLLQSAVNLKITTEARQGIQRIEQFQSQAQADALRRARLGCEDNPEPGFLVLESMSAEHKQAVVKKFAAIMEIDPYSAKLQLPSRGWRLYRLGQMGELQFYRDRLLQAEIPCFCVSQHSTQQMFVFQVGHLQSFQPKGEIVCTDDRGELRTFNFNWSEVTQVVTGILPIFEEVMELDAYNRTFRKPKILDYVHVCDLQLRDRRSIFRLCSQTYNFCEYKQSLARHRHEHGDFSSQLSTDLVPSTAQRLPATSRDNWKNLISQISEQVAHIHTQSNFTPFAETAIGYPELMGHIEPHLELLRRADSLWDRAFHLYSTLSMCRE